MPNATRKVLRLTSGYRAKSCLSIPIAKGMNSRKATNFSCRSFSSARAGWPGLALALELELGLGIGLGIGLGVELGVVIEDKWLFCVSGGGEYHGVLTQMRFCPDLPQANVAFRASTPGLYIAEASPDGLLRPWFPWVSSGIRMLKALL